MLLWPYAKDMSERGRGKLSAPNPNPRNIVQKSALSKPDPLRILNLKSMAHDESECGQRTGETFTAAALSVVPRSVVRHPSPARHVCAKNGRGEGGY